MMNKLFDKLSCFMPNEIKMKVEKEKLEPVNVNSSIGEQIRYYRCLAGMRQEDVAMKIGYTRAIMNKYETEPIQLLNVETFNAIIKELGIKDKIVLNDDYLSFVLKGPGKVISDFMSKHHLSKYEFADILGVDVYVVKSWENGKRQITRKTYEKYKKILDLYEKKALCKT